MPLNLEASPPNEVKLQVPSGRWAALAGSEQDRFSKASSSSLQPHLQGSPRGLGSRWPREKPPVLTCWVRGASASACQARERQRGTRGEEAALSATKGLGSA